MKKQSRGSYDFSKVVDQNVIAVKWHDNNIVSLCSNFAGIEPIHHVRRFSRKENNKIQVRMQNK